MQSRSSGGRPDRLLGGQPVTADDAVVVDPHQLDHLVDILLAADPTRGHRVLAGEDRVVDDHPALPEVRAQLLAEREVGGTVAVQMSHFATLHAETPLPALAVAGLDARPRPHGVGDLLAGCSGLVGHWSLGAGGFKLQAQVSLMSGRVPAFLSRWTSCSPSVTSRSAAASQPRRFASTRIGA